MNNKRVLQKATKELDKAKAPVKKKDIIVDPMGQWKYPGQVTRIPSDTITMEGVDYPVLGVPDNGQPVMMQPGAYYDFPGANYVDEYPQMKKGGGLKTKKYTRSIEGTNYLFAESDLFKKPKKLSKKRIFHPNAKYYAEGGALLTKKVTCKKCGWKWDAADGGDDITTCHKCGGQGLVHAQDGGEIEYNGFKYKKDKSGKWINSNSGAPVTDQLLIQKLTYEGKPVGSPVVQSAPKPKPISTVTKQQQLETIKNSPVIADQRKANELQDEIRNENIYFPKGEPSEDEPEGIEGAVNSALDYPMAKAALSAEFASNEGQVDNFRHANAGRYTAEAIKDMTGNIPYLSDAAAIIGANALGLGHEVGAWFQHSDEDTRPWTSKLRESGEDMYNNFVGTTVGVSGMTPVEKTDKLLNLSYSNQLPDGVDNPNKPRPGTSNNMYFKQGPNDPGKYKSRYDDGGEYVELDLTPEEIQEYAKRGFIVEDVLNHMAEGGDPGDIQCPPGYVYNPETKYCEKKSGCPDGYTLDPKSGRCVSNYQKESIKIMAAPYKYDKDGDVLDFPNEYEDSEFSPISEDDLKYSKSAQKSTWPKDFYVKEILNPIYFTESGYTEITSPDYKPEYEGEYESGIYTYPDLNYKVVVDSKKPEGFNKDESIYYVQSENTHQFKKYKEWEKLKQIEKENLDNAKKYGFVIKEQPPREDRKYPEQYYRTLKEGAEGFDDTDYIYNQGWDAKSYNQEYKKVQELYNDPEYLGGKVYNKSYDETFKDRGKKNIENYKNLCPDCTYFHGQRMTVDPDYIYESYNPYQNKVVDGQMTRAFKTLENDYADPFAVQQMPTIEEYEYPEGPSYNPVGYKGQGIHPVWGEDTKKILKVGVHPGKRSSLKDKFYVETESVPDRDFRGFGKHEKTKLIPSIVQKATGYDPQKMEGYFNEEGDWIPGEYENAEEEGRRINFNGAASLRDLKNQKEYEEQYAKFLKEKEDVDRLNKELRQQWLPQEEISSYAKGGASGCPPGYTKVNGRCVNTRQWQDVPEKNKFKSKKVQPFVTSDPDEYAYRKAAYDDSLYLVKEYNSKQPKAEKYMDYRGILINTRQPAVRTVNGFEPTGTNPNYSGSSRAGWSPAWEKYMKNTQNYDTPFENRPIGYAFQKTYFDRHALVTPFGTKTVTLPGEKQLESMRTEPRFKPPVQPVIFAKPQEKKEYHYPKKETKTDNTKKPVPPGKTYQGDYTESSTLDPKTGKVVTIKEPIYEDRLPIREPERGSLQPFVKINYPPGPPPYHGVEPNIQVNEVPMYATPDSGAEFVPQTERYIDWDGNSIGFNGVRFRKPGHGGDLIKKGRKHYIHYPSIETRHSADIVPEEEEFGMGGITKYPNGGESKPRKVRREVKPFTTSNLKEYQKRKQAYDDSLTLYKAGLEEYDLTTKTKGLIDSPLYEPEAYEAYKRLGYPKGYNVNMKRSDNTNTRGVMYEKPVQSVNKKTKPVPKKSKPVPKKSQQVKPFVTSDPKEYALRKAAYDDSLRYYNAYQMQDKLMGPGSKIEKNSKQTWTTKDLQAGRKKRIVKGLEKYGPIAQDYQSEAHQFKKGYNNDTARKADRELIKYYKSLGFTDKEIMYHSSPDVVSDKIKAVGSYYDGNASSPVYRKPMQEVIFQKNIQEDSQIQPIIPIEQPQPPIQDNYPPPPVGGFPPGPPPPPPFNGVEPFIQGDPIPEYATPDRDAQWVAQKERYIDWNGNNISYKLPRFRKPGHSGPLVKGSRTHYLRYPSIETRNSADIIPEEEEFAMGGEYNLGDEIELTEAEVKRLKSLGYIIEEV